MTPDAKPAETQDIYPVVMPKLGLTMTQATLVEWLQEDGDRVEKGERLFVLESDKSTLEIEAPASGILHILVSAGETVPVQTPVAHLLRGQEFGARVPPTTVRHPEPPAHLESRCPTPNSPIPDSPIPASPRARHAARRLGISLERISGTGARGMIVAADVERAAAMLTPSPAESPAQASPVARRVAAQAGLDLSAVAGTGPGGRIMRQDVEQVLHARPEPVPRSASEASLPEPSPGLQSLSGLRAIIAERLSASWRERPHVTLITEADATNLISARQQAMSETGQKISYDAFLVALAARALGELPHMNVRLSAQGIEQQSRANVGVAVDTERGLLVPVVRDAGIKSLLQVQHALQELVERARAGRSLPDDLTGGTFTITNLGMFEIDAFTPIINPPESAILGVGRIVARPVAVDRQVVVRDMMALSLSFDHRLIDGAPAARFLQRVKQLVERPFALAISREGEAAP